MSVNYIMCNRIYLRRDTGRQMYDYRCFLLIKLNNSKHSPAKINSEAKLLNGPIHRWPISSVVTNVPLYDATRASPTPTSALPAIKPELNRIPLSRLLFRMFSSFAFSVKYLSSPPAIMGVVRYSGK